MGEPSAIKRKSYLIPPTLMKDIGTQSLIDNEGPGSNSRQTVHLSSLPVLISNIMNCKTKVKRGTGEFIITNILGHKMIYSSGPLSYFH